MSQSAREAAAELHRQPVEEEETGDEPTSSDWEPFEGLLKQTWEWDEEWNFATQVDEVFLGALITSTLNNDYFLMAISSDGTHHDLAFEHLENASRVIYRVSYLSDTLPVAKILGHRVSVIFGYGERIKLVYTDDAAPEHERFGLEEMASPGTLILQADEDGEYAYAKLELTLNISEYVGENYGVDTDLLGGHVKTITRALRSYLQHRAR